MSARCQIWQRNMPTIWRSWNINVPKIWPNPQFWFTNCTILLFTCRYPKTASPSNNHQRTIFTITPSTSPLAGIPPNVAIPDFVYALACNRTTLTSKRSEYLRNRFYCLRSGLSRSARTTGSSGSAGTERTARWSWHPWRARINWNYWRERSSRTAGWTGNPGTAGELLMCAWLHLRSLSSVFCAIFMILISDFVASIFWVWQI